MAVVQPSQQGAAQGEKLEEVKGGPDAEAPAKAAKAPQRLVVAALRKLGPSTSKDQQQQSKDHEVRAVEMWGGSLHPRTCMDNASRVASYMARQELLGLGAVHWYAFIILFEPVV